VLVCVSGRITLLRPAGNIGSAARLTRPLDRMWAAPPAVLAAGRGGFASRGATASPPRELSWSTGSHTGSSNTNFMTARERVNSMEKVKATVSGNIQSVGYRARVIDIAKTFGMTGFVQNLNDGRVRIIAESDNGNLDGFLDAIRIKNTLINVDAVEVEHADATGDFDDFYKLLDTAAEYLKEMIGIMRAGFSDMRSGFENLDSKMDVMIEKQDATLNEIRGLREDMKSYMDMKFGEIEDELSAMKNALKEHGISY